MVLTGNDLTPDCSSKRIYNREVLSWISLPILLLILLGFFFFPSAGHDDAHITYWGAYSLAKYGEIVNYNGDRIEQSSSLSQVLFLALMSKVFKVFNINIAALGIFSSILFGVLTILVLYGLASRVEPGIAFISVLLTGTSAYFIYWSFGGLETTMMSFASVYLVYIYTRFLEGAVFSGGQWVGLIGAAVLFLTVRPETFIVLICMFSGAIVIIFLKKISSGEPLGQHYREILTRLFILLGISVLVSALITGARLLYFGSPFPQPVTAKSKGLTFEFIPKGFSYLKSSLVNDRYILVLTVLGMVGIVWALLRQFKAKKLNLYILFSLLFSAAYISFIVMAGGDWMEGGRFLVHLLPVAAMFIAFLIKRAVKSRKILLVCLVILVMVQGKTVINLAQKYSTAMPLWGTFNYYEPLVDTYQFKNFSWFERYNRVHIRDIPAIYHFRPIIEKILVYKEKKNGKGQKVSVMSGQAGMVAYYVAKAFYKQIRFIDRHGIIDQTLTGCKVTAGIRKYTMGLFFLYYHLFRDLKILKKKCNIDKPDIIFDLKFKDAKLIVGNGYTMVYSQEGKVSSNSQWLPGFVIYFDQFIAVRNDLLPALKDFKRKHLEFHQLYKGEGTEE